MMTEQNLVSYEQATEVVKNWYDNPHKVLMIAFIDTNCETCEDFHSFIIPEINRYEITVFEVNIADNFIPFPPLVTPTTYWFFDKNMPPLQKKGIPPTKKLLIELIGKIFKVKNGESTVEKEFF